MIETDFLHILATYAINNTDQDNQPYLSFIKEENTEITSTEIINNEKQSILKTLLVYGSILSIIGCGIDLGLHSKKEKFTKKDYLKAAGCALVAALPQIIYYSYKKSEISQLDKKKKQIQLLTQVKK